VSGQADNNGRGKKIALIGTIVVLMLALLGYGVHALLNMKRGNKVKPPKITLMIPQAPPPPPPPPKFEKKPDPPKEQKEMKVDQQVVKKVEDQAPPELKMDGPAGNGPSAFASGAITSEDLSKIGSGKGGGGEKTGMFSPFNNYAGLTKGELQRYLGKNNTLRHRRYTVEIDVWVDGAGSIKRFELVGSSKDSDIDEAIRTTLAAFPNFSEPPPASMPQPIRYRIVTRG
jgi:protein TonB